MKVVSELHYDEYRAAMKEQMGRFTAFGMERFTGVVLGRFFYITYHSGHEFNRRITNEKNRAIGIVGSSEQGTKVSALCFAGYTDPVSVILLYLCSLLCIYSLSLANGIGFSAGMYAYAVIPTGICAILTAIQTAVTQRGQEGRRIVEAFLLDPSDYYQYIN